MVWGGAFDEKGSDYIRYLVQADKTIKFLEKFKEEVNPKEKEYLAKTIEVIVDYFSKRRSQEP